RWSHWTTRVLAALGPADRIEPLQGASLVGGGPAAEVRHTADRLTPGDDRRPEGVAPAEKVLDHGDRNGTEPGHLTDLVLDRPAPQQGLQVDPHENLGSGGAPAPVFPAPADGFHQGIEGIGLGRLPPRLSV